MSNYSFACHLKKNIHFWGIYLEMLTKRKFKKRISKRFKGSSDALHYMPGKQLLFRIAYIFLYLK